ncbi:DUF6056 family protein [Algoriphagus sp. oki45]
MVSLLGGYSSEFNKTEKFLITCLLLFGLWMGFVYHISTSIYWATGSFYTYANLVCILSLYFLIKRPNSLALNSILLLVLGLSGVNLALIGISFLLINLKLGISKISWRNFWIYLLVSSVALGVVIIAPGNFERAQGEFDFSPYSILSNYLSIWVVFNSLSRWIILLPLVFAFLVKPTTANPIKYAILFFGLSLIYILPFSALENAASARTSMTFQTMHWLGIYFLSSYLIDHFDIRLSKEACLFLALVIFGYFNYVISRQIILGMDIKKQLLARYEFLESKRGSSELITLKPVEFDLSTYINRMYELTEDPEFHANLSTAKYFGVSKIVVP